MWTYRTAGLAVIVSAGALVGPSALADEKRPDTPPALAGKWRQEVKQGDDSRTTVYLFLKDGRVEIETQIKTARHEVFERIKGDLVAVGKDRLTIVHVARVSKEGVEEAIPKERRRTRTVRYLVMGDELHWIPVDDNMESKPSVLKRVKE